MKEKLKSFNINIDDIENDCFDNGMIEEIAKECTNRYDSKRYELILNENIINVKDLFTGDESYMGMKISLEPLEKEISFIVRPTNKPTYEELYKENLKLKDTLNRYQPYFNGIDLIKGIDYFVNNEETKQELEKVLPIIKE